MDRFVLIRPWEGKDKDGDGDPDPVLEAYLDTGGVWTIGWGHTKGVKKGDVCTEEQAELWLQEDAKEAEDAIKKYVKVPLNDNQYAALLSFVFNVGSGAFMRSTLLRYLNEKNYVSAGDQLMNWVYDNGKIIKGLQNRRAAEKKLWETPVSDSR